MILTGKNNYLIQYKNDRLAVSDLFDMFTQSVKFCYTFYYHVLKVQMFEKCDSSNRQLKWMLLLPASFTAKFELAFVWALENAYS